MRSLKNRKLLIQFKMNAILLRYLQQIVCMMETCRNMMGTTRLDNKIARLQQIESLLLDHPEGLTQAELARRLGVNRSTIHRNLIDVGSYVYEEDGRCFIDRKAYLVSVRFNLHEALSIHLAARLLTQTLDRQNPNAASALRKLGMALDRLAPLISEHLARSADAIEEDARWQDANYLRILEILTMSWAERRKVRIWFSGSSEEPVREFVFSTYYIEPVAAGRSTYAIGLRQPPDEVRTFKIERIQRAEMLRETFSIPGDFDPSALLHDAWGIWYTGHEPVDVILKFGPRATKRVGETRWHRSEQVMPQADGSLLWRALIAEPREMLPWIRGWGAEVEVIAPPELREALIHEVRLMAETYHLG